MLEGYAKGLFEAACKEFDRTVPQKHPSQTPVTIGRCPEHFVDRLLQRVLSIKNLPFVEEILVASIRYIENKYDFFSSLKENQEYGIVYKNYNIKYQCKIYSNESGIYRVEVTPVTIFKQKI